MTISEQYQLLRQQLRHLYTQGEAESIAFWVLEHYTGLGRMTIKANGQRLLSHHEVHLISNALQQLLNHRPVQYVLGEAWFKGLIFHVNESVFIPRPETEELVNLCVASRESQSALISILEIGVGSGCISIAIKQALPLATITAIDISEAALKVAKENALRLKTDIQLQQADFLLQTTWRELPQYDMIVSNPPYIPIKEKNHLDKNVTAYEPEQALFIPDEDPLLFYRKIAAFGKTHLKASGSIFVECHQDYAKATQQMFEEAGYRTTLKKDVFENDRMLSAWLDD